MKKNTNEFQRQKRRKALLSLFFAVVAVFYLMPIALVLINSFKANTFVNLEPFAMPSEESFMGWGNYEKGMTFGNYPFLKSALYSIIITVVSTALILICTQTKVCGAFLLTLYSNTREKAYENKM